MMIVSSAWHKYQGSYSTSCDSVHAQNFMYFHGTKNDLPFPLNAKPMHSTDSLESADFKTGRDFVLGPKLTLQGLISYS